MKTCRGCGEDKDHSQFNKQTASRDGLHSWCRKCSSEASLAWQKANRERWRETQRAYDAKTIENKRARHRRWKRTYPDRARAADAQRIAGKILATPSWADHEAIRAVYTTAHTLTQSTGILHHVDHIVPLRGRNVCGLHVHYNLRAIPAVENLRKGNRLDEELHAPGSAH